MAKKKTSANDFLKLLDDQEATDRPAIKRKKSQPAETSKLSPVQRELLEFVVRRTPNTLTNLVTSNYTRKIADRVGIPSEVFTFIERVKQG